MQPKQKVRLLGTEINTPLVLFATGVVGVFGLLAYSLTETSNFFQTFGYLFLLGISSLLAGAIIGFLFGIPKTLAISRGDSEKTGNTPNTNLEEISDWLTKIIVGLGISQITRIPDKLGELTSYLSSNASTINSDVILYVLIFFSIFGFFVAFLSTRIYLGTILSNSDRVALQNEEDLDEFVGENQQYPENTKFKTGDFPNLTRVQVAEIPAILNKVEYLELSGFDISSKKYKDLGLILIGAKKFGLAAKYFEKSILKDKSDNISLSNLAVITGKHFKEFEKADLYFEQILENDKKNSLALYNSACNKIRMDKNNDALVLLERALDIDKKKLLPIAQKDYAFKPLEANKQFQALVPDYDPNLEDDPVVKIK